ncbi:hypothetical protein T01_8135 [Trichinella spiralis]|uniref:Uncharacterized protein n=1 Tax=Trichinella spiralis TaxID=6334 RepID=A0A0V1BU54_TRISP|nr:hypothetical protein T01_8135 [Trichinella spiralis]
MNNISFVKAFQKSFGKLHSRQNPLVRADAITAVKFVLYYQEKKLFPFKHWNLSSEYHSKNLDNLVAKFRMQAKNLFCQAGQIQANRVDCTRKLHQQEVKATAKSEKCKEEEE